MVQHRDLGMLAELIADYAVFVRHRPVAGRDHVVPYLIDAMHTLGVGEGFRSIREVAFGDTAVLEFEAVLDGLDSNGVDSIRFAPTIGSSSAR